MRKFWLLFSFLIAITGCSNPFSNTSRSILKQNPQTKNVNCDEVRFDQGEFNPAQLRALTHCFNQKHELDGVESWMDSVSDDELQPWSTRLNLLLQNEPRTLYGIKEVYLQQKESGALQKVFSQLSAQLQQKNNVDTLTQILKKHSLWLSRFFANPEYQINTASLALLSDVKSFHRGVSEQWQTQQLATVLRAIENYRKQSDALSFEKLFALFSRVSSETIANADSAENIAGFMNWLIQDQRLDLFSRAAEALATSEITCFSEMGGKGLKINQPLDTLIEEFKTMNAKKASDYIQHEAPVVLMMGNAYCKIPSELSEAHRALVEATLQNGFTDFYEFLKPMFSDENFSKLLRSKSFRDLAAQISSLNRTHIFQDILTLINWLSENPVIRGNTAVLFDSYFNEFNSNESLALLEMIPEDSSLFKTIHEIVRSIPHPEKLLSFSSTENWLSILAHDTVAPALRNILKLHSENKVFGLIDQTFEVFKKLIARGKGKYKSIIVAKLRHSKNTESQNWLLEFNSRAITNINEVSCIHLPTAWNFAVSQGEFSKQDYLSKMDQLIACYGANQSFRTLKDLAEYSLEKSKNGDLLLKINSLQKRVMGLVFNLDASQTFQTFDQFLGLSDEDQTALNTSINSLSGILSFSQNEVIGATELRKLLARYAAQASTYQAILSQKNAKTAVISNPIDSKKLKLITKTLKELPAMFEEFCPSMDLDSPDCDIEDAQVKLYEKSPKTLAAQLVDEYFESSQTWLHPAYFKSWKSDVLQPSDVGTFEYHLNPLLKQFEGSPDAGEAVFSFVKRNEKSIYDLTDFISDKSKVVSLMPYIYQDQDYPRESSQEFHQRIHLRLANDMNRLELLAINADFKPFGMMKNFGMSFIREIALAWGDVPENQRPVGASSETLSDARSAIIAEYQKFNKNILQRIGSCDPRGKRKLGRWFKNKLCKGELGDIRARMFNLEYIISVLDDDREMILLRDLFYSLYEHNSNDQRGFYSNGVNEPEECLSSKPTDVYCKRDLLEIIPKAARLGLLHQASLSMVLQQSPAVPSTVAILKQVFHEGKGSEISKFLASNEGSQTIRDVITLGMKLSESELSRLGSLIGNLSKIKNSEWLSFILQIAKKNPSLIATYSPTLQKLLESNEPVSLTPEMIELASRVSSDLKNETLANELSQIIKSAAKSQDYLQALVQLQFSSQFSENLSREWLSLLSQSQNQNSRDQISSFLTSSDFENFCVVFSDSQNAQKTYNFLESLNQNSGVIDLINECRRFLR